MNRTIQVVRNSMTKGLNGLLYGDHGVGKTQLIRDIANSLGLKLKYYSAATLDPYSDVVGIPVPVDNIANDGVTHKQLQFIRPHDIDEAEIVFFDEFNRCSSENTECSA